MMYKAAFLSLFPAMKQTPTIPDPPANKKFNLIKMSFDSEAWKTSEAEGKSCSVGHFFPVCFQYFRTTCVPVLMDHRQIQTLF